MTEINLLDRYPRSRRNLDERSQATDEDRRLAMQFGREYFDGDRNQGYGGYNYHPRFWQETVKRLRDYYQLAGDASVLDVGCAKGFMLHDFKELMPRLHVHGLDISRYAFENAIEDMKPFLVQGNVRSLPFPDGSFDLVVAINTIHNLPERECRTAVRELQRVSRGHGFIVVDAYRNEAERRAIETWVLTARTVLSVEGWRSLFAQCGYTGDYYWFTPR